LAVVGATLGQVGIVPSTIVEGNINQNISRIRVKEHLIKIIQPRYLGIYLSTSIGQKLIRRNATITTQVYLNNEQLGGIRVPVLNPSLQARIVKISEVANSERKSKEKKALEIIKSVDKTIAHKIGFIFPEIENKSTFEVRFSSFEKRLDPHFYLPGFKSLIDSIRKIKHSQLGDIIEFSNEAWNQREDFDKEFPYIEISEIDLTSGKIRNINYVPVAEAPSRAKMIVRENDIIVSTTRPHRGAIAYITKEQDGVIASTGFAILRKLRTIEVSKEYLFYILRTQICLQQMLQRSSGGSYPAITSEELKKLLIPIPAINIQEIVIKDIKAFIEKAEELKAEAQIELQKAKQEIEALILS
jgi:type I restriction enzyme S subunit